ncbi:MAG: M1 family metallopeptidase, partial [Deltaproteobacteria bacterium]|nr:M1 family metallopeptidase [Deltaproteobacteria bacterium]
MRREFALPGTEARYARDRLFDVEHVKIDVDLDFETRSITASCSLTVRALVSERWLQLDAVELDIDSVRRRGKNLAFEHDGEILHIDLGAQAKVGKTFTIVVDYTAQPRRGLYFVGPEAAYPDKPIQAWTQGQDEDSRYWFPCFDSPHEKATSEVIATVPPEFYALSNGKLVSDKVKKGRRQLHWSFDQPHSCYLITLVAGEFDTVRDRWDGVEVTYHVAKGRKQEAKRTLAKTPKMLALFSKLFGVSYPYNKYAQVFVGDFIFGGMENTTATTLTDVVLLDERAALDYDVEALVAHELAHQWFGDLITCRDWGQGWLNEGFATYSEYLWREHASGRDEATLELEEFATQYFSEDSDRYRRKIATNLYEFPIDIFDHHLYEKGARVVHMLRRELGDDAFFRSLAHYLGKHRHRSVETRDLARAIEEQTGRVLDWFFDQWVLNGAGHPVLEIGYRWDAEHEQAIFVVKQAQESDSQTPVFRLPTQLRVRVGKHEIDVPIEVRDQQQTFVVPCKRAPSQAIFDPGKHLLAELRFDKPTSLSIAELRSATEAIDRIDAARALGKKGGAQAAEALARALRKDPFWGVRAAAADALGKLRSDRARDLLVRELATKHPKVRRAVVRALGQFRGDEIAFAAVERLVRGSDDSYFVEAEACTSLGKIGCGARQALEDAAQRDSFMDIIRRHAYRGLAELGDDSALDVLVAGTEYGRVSHGRRDAALSAAKLVRGRRDTLATRVRRRCEDLL